MKILLLLRHAKSSRKFPDLSDHDRPLNHRGKRDAPRTGRLLKEKGLVPDLVISSTAIRAKDTASAVAKHSGYKGKIIKVESLYAAEPAAYLTVLRNLAQNYNQVLVVGHNPGVEELIETLTGEIHIISTCTLARIEFDIEKWSAILRERTDRGRLVEILRPDESDQEIQRMTRRGKPNDRCTYKVVPNTLRLQAINQAPDEVYSQTMNEAPKFSETLWGVACTQQDNSQKPPKRDTRVTREI